MSNISDPALFRLLLVVSVAVAFALYTRLHLVGGGSLSGGYIAILIVSGQWWTLLGLIVVTAVTMALMRGVLLRLFALPRSWVFVMSVLMSSLVTVALAALAPVFESVTSVYALAIAFGAYVVPGLLCYDASHQGIQRTALALASITLVTLALCWPAFALMSGLPESTPNVAPFVARIPADLMPFAIVAAIVIGAVLRFTGNLRTGGFIGALFISEFFTVQAFLAVGATAVIAHVVMRAYGHYVVMTPRQRSMGALILGAIIAWGSIYWGAALGWVPAMESNAFALSPLLAVGLMAADMGRSNGGVLRTLVGTGIAVIGIAAALQVAQSFGLIAGVGLLMLLCVGAVPAILGLARSWQAAERAGRERVGTITP